MHYCQMFNLQLINSLLLLNITVTGSRYVSHSIHNIKLIHYIDTSINIHIPFVEILLIIKHCIISNINTKE